MPAPSRYASIALLPLAVLAVSACGPGKPTAQHTAAPTRSPSPSPSPVCPTAADLTRAAGVAASTRVTVPGRITCAAGYAAATLHSAEVGDATIVVHREDGTWHQLVLGSSICEPEDGRRPKYLVGVPDTVMTAAGCDPSYYSG